jgi:O-antigen ligase
MPFMASIFPQYTRFTVSPENLKLAWGVIGTSILFTIYFYKQLKLPKIELVKSSLYVPIFGFILWNFVSLLWVIDTYLATIMLTQFIVASLFYVVIINLFKTDFQIEKITTYIVISMTVVSVIGLFQYYLPLNEFWINFYWSVAPPGATFGNKNMASHFIVMALPLAVVGLFSAKNYLQIFSYSVASFIGYWFIIVATAKQAYVAIFVQMFLLLIILILDNWKNKQQSLVRTFSFQKLKSFTASIILLLLIFVLSYTNQNLKDKGLVEATVQNISVYSSSAKARFPAWNNTVEMIKDSPLLGVGIGQWQHKYPQYYDRIDKDTIFNEHTRLQKLHNDYLEMFANVGLVGYVFLIALLVLVVKKIWNILINAKNNDRFHILALTLGLIGFSVVALFSFPIRVFMPAFLVMVYIAIIEFYALKNSKKTLVFNYTNKYKYLGFVLMLAASFFTIRTTLYWLTSESFRNNSVIFLKAGADREGLYLADYSLKYNNKDWQGFASAGMARFKLGDINESIPYFKKAIDLSPFNTIVLLNLAIAYDKIGNYGMEKKVLDFVLRIDPNNVKANAMLVPILLKNKMFEDLKIVYSNMKTNFEYFKNRSNFGPYHFEVIHAAGLLKDYKYIKYIYNDAIERDLFSGEDNYLKLAVLNFYYLHNKKEGVNWYRKALELDQNLKHRDEIMKIIDEYESISTKV